MAGALVDTTSKSQTEEAPRYQGITTAEVVSNLDTKGLQEGLVRVQIRLPWLAGVAVWARVATPMAGLNHGAYFVPLPGSEVVVGFENGDTARPVILGSVFGGRNRSPALLPNDPTTKRLIRTPLGHEIEFNDATQSISIKTNSQQQIVLDPTGIKMTTIGPGGSTTTTLDAAGNVSITASTSISLKAPTINLQGATVNVTGTSAANINGGKNCSIKAGMVFIN